MSTLTETVSWDPVYQFATTDPVQGGPGGIDNDPHQNLVNRTALLRVRLAGIITPTGLAESITDQTQLTQTVQMHVQTVAALRNAPVPTVPSGTNLVIMTRGQNQERDTLGQPFVWNGGAIASDDGVSIIRPAALGAGLSGRWVAMGLNAANLGGQPAGYFAGAQATAAAMALLAPLLSPNLQGTPTTTMPPTGDVSYKIAPTNWVHQNFLAQTDAASFYLTIANAASTYLNKITGGTVSGPVALNAGGTSVTPATSDDDTSIATTAFVQNVVAAYAPLVGPIFSGSPQSPTPTDYANGSQIATTNYVQRAIAGSLTLNGLNYSFQPLATGMLIRKGGRITVAANPTTFSFATLTGTNFPTACLGCGITPYGQTSDADVLSYSATGFEVGTAVPGAQYTWWADGH